MRVMRRKREQDQLYNLRSHIPPQQPGQDNGKDEVNSEYSSASPKPDEQVTFKFINRLCTGVMLTTRFKYPRAEGLMAIKSW